MAVRRSQAVRQFQHGHIRTGQVRTRQSKAFGQLSGHSEGRNEAVCKTVG